LREIRTVAAQLDTVHEVSLARQAGQRNAGYPPVAGKEEEMIPVYLAVLAITCWTIWIVLRGQQQRKRRRDEQRNLERIFAPPGGMSGIALRLLGRKKDDV